MGGEMPFYQDYQATALRTTKDEDALFGLIAWQTQGDFYRGQLIRALHLLKTNNPDKKVYTWVVSAVRLFVDTRRIVGNELAQCFDEAQALQKWMSAALEQPLLFSHTNTVNDYYKKNSNVLQLVEKQIDNILKKDLVQPLLDDFFGARAARYSWGPFYLLRNHPMILGLIIQHFLVDLHELGIGLTGDQGAVMTSIHLYNTS